MARTYTAEALVLKKVNLNEADRLITVLSKYKGKFTSIAKGVRKIASRRNPNLELFNHIKAHFASGKNFDVVTEVETIQTFKGIKNSLQKTASTFFILEVTNGFLADDQGDRETFDLLSNTLRRLEEAKTVTDIKKIMRFFEVNLLERVGLKPQMKICLKCREVVENQVGVVSPELGGVLHPNCALSTIFTKTVSPKGLKTIKFLQERNWSEVKRLLISKETTRELESLLYFYLEYLLEKKIKSGEFLLSLEGFQRKSGRFAN